MYKLVHHRPARFDTTPIQQLRDGFAGRAFLPQLHDYFPTRLEISETWSAARLKLRGSLPDKMRVNGGHTTGDWREIARQLRR